MDIFIEKNLDRIDSIGGFFGKFLGKIVRYVVKHIIALIFLLIFGIGVFVYALIDGARKKK